MVYSIRLLIAILLSLPILGLASCTNYRPSEYDPDLNVFNNYQWNYSLTLPDTYFQIPPESPEYDRVTSHGKMDAMLEHASVVFFNRLHKAILLIEYDKSPQDTFYNFRSKYLNEQFGNDLGMHFSAFLKEILEKEISKDINRRFLVLQEFKPVASGEGVNNRYIIIRGQYYLLDFEQILYVALIFPKYANIQGEILESDQIATLVMGVASEKQLHAKLEIEKLTKSFRFDAFTATERRLPQ